LIFDQNTVNAKCGLWLCSSV